MFPIVSLKRVHDPETDTYVEDWVMVFKDDERESNPTSYKFLQMARAWKAKGGVVLPISGGTDGKADQEGDKEKGRDEDTNTRKERGKDKEKARDDGDDDGSDVASSHGGDGDDD